MIRLSAFFVLATLLSSVAVLAPLSPAGAQETAAPRVNGRFVLQDQDGRTVSDESFAGTIRVMTFGYTFCPDVCPTTLATMAEALDKLGPVLDQVTPIFISVDPQRDNPAHLKDYVKAFHPRLIGLTGSPEAVATAAHNFRVRYQINAAPDGDPDAYTVDHSAGIFIMGRDGRFLAKLGYLESADVLAERIRQVVQQ